MPSTTVLNVGVGVDKNIAFARKIGKANNWFILVRVLKEIGNYVRLLNSMWENNRSWAGNTVSGYLLVKKSIQLNIWSLMPLVFIETSAFYIQ